jgi:pyruvate dehydrogenase phosphatase regulatory subunit
MCFVSYCLQHLDFITVVRDLDGYIYFRENDGSLLAGGFEPVAKPAFEDGTIPGKTD